jgi:hypothetical protein
MASKMKILTKVFTTDGKYLGSVVWMPEDAPFNFSRTEIQHEFESSLWNPRWQAK